MAKRTRSNANDTATSTFQPRAARAVTGQEPAPVQSAPPEPSEHEIRLRAYHRYLERGAFDGADFDDWLQAEMELKKR